ncbi:cell wall-binding repeat-containing protein [Romboutsia ilealis]|uniref:cell wall-binding repeat-containing protein n=1 Tax=Romboutsia ilealis TaxID=1115758 RepID=UPI0025B750E0|nr:cell wall-binding repeat-containing protein [Romboutsia ilealis]
MLKRKEIISKLLATTMFLSTVTSSVSALEPRATVTSSTLAGADRYETAVKVSENGWTSATNAVIINGDKGLVDALTATPYASLKNAPILVTEKDKLTTVTKNRLTRLGVKNVDIVGGEAVVSQAVENELKAMGLTVNRIKGDDRYSTSVAVANEIKKLTTVNKIAVVNGDTGLPDAVSIAAPAADNNMPIILSDPSNNNGISEAKSFIESNNISKSYVIGQTSAVSNNIMNTLPGTKTRLGGTDRHETNAQVIKEFYAQKELDNIYVAKSGYIKNNEELVDALAVGVLAAKNDDPVLIVGKTLDKTQETLLKEKNFDKITQVGGGIPQGSIDAIKSTQSSTKEVKTVAELKTALSSARSGDIINFRPSSTISTTVDISSTTNVTVNLYNTYTSTVNADLSNGIVNVYGTISGKLSVNDANKVAVQSSAKVTTLDIKSGAKDIVVDNKGTVTTLDVAATGVSINNSGTINTLNKLSDTKVDGNGTIGNMPVDTSKPVSQVIVENGKEITVRFSQSIDSIPSIVSITKVSTIDSANLIKRLNSDKKTMTITAKKGEIFKGTYDLVIDGIVSNGTKLDKYTTTFTAAKDEKAPQVTNVAFNQDTNKIEITLSEPIDTTSDAILRLNDISKEASIHAITNPTNKITITRPSDISLGTSVKIYIAGIKDASGNTMESYNGTLTLSRVDLTISEVKQIATDKIRVTFNKKLPTGQTITTSEIKVYKSGDKNKTQLVKGVSSLNSDGKSFDITVNADSIFTGTTVSQSVYVELAADACTDNTGVKNKAISKSLTLTKDTVKPTVKSTVLNTAKDGLEITLSEDINVVANTNISGIVLKRNGVNLDTEAKLKANTKNVIVVKTTDSSFLENGKLKAGNYRAYIPSGAFTDLSGNAVNAVNTTEIEIGETTTSKDAMNLIINQVNPNEFTVTTTGSSVTVNEDDVFKYSSDLYKSFSIDGDILPSNTNVAFTGHDNKTIKVILPNNYVKSTGKAQLKVSGLTVKSGRTVNSKTQTIDVQDNINPTLEKVELVTVKDKANTKNIKRYEMKLTFDEAIKLNNQGATLDTLLASVKMSSGKIEFDGKGKNIACTYKLYGTKQVIITLTPEQISSSNWTTVVSNSSTTIFEVTNNIDIITDMDTTNGRTPLAVRKGTKLNIVKNSISE